ncbi:methyltransferase [Thermoproteota archaeon]
MSRNHDQRRKFGEPEAYIRRYVDFFNRIFYVDRRVYIPNHETENMVSLLLEDLSEDSAVLDIGTGSGSIAITVKKEMPLIKVYGSDIDPSTLDVARFNAELHNADIRFFESCYADDIPIEPTHIISDMPWGDERYVLGSNNLEEMKHLPPISVFHPQGPLTAYKELIQSIQTKEWKPKLFFESGLVEKIEVENIIPKGMEWDYIQFDDYSVTVVDFANQNT